MGFELQMSYSNSQTKNVVKLSCLQDLDLAEGQSMRKQYEQDLQIYTIGFSAMVCISLGMILLTSVLFLAGARPIWYFAWGAIGTISLALMYRRIAANWRAVSAHEHIVLGSTAGKSGNLARFCASVFLAILGYVGAAAAGSGWITAFTPYLLLVFFFPWSRIALCRQSMVVSLLIPCAGMVAGLAMTSRLPHPLSLGAIVWILWISAVIGWLRLILIDRHELRSNRAVEKRLAATLEGGSDVLHHS